MNASNTQAAGPSAPAVVRPSWFVRVVIRPLTKVLNPVMMTMAGRRHVRMAAQVRHVGRKSGRQYVTPVGAGRSGDTFVIPLTFGNQSDWSRNIRAAGGCSIRMNGVDYRVNQPELADRAQAAPVVRAAFGPVMRAGFGVLGIRQVLLLKLADA
jgi:deazaflavin-dependent oxidoreductase (nitroreductase family)